MKDAAKILLEHGSLEAYVKTFIDDSAFEYLIDVLKDSYREDVKEALIENDEDLEDYDPIYDDCDELISAEKENIIDDGTELLLTHLPLHGDMVTKRRDEIYDIIYKEVTDYVKLMGVNVFYG